MESLIYLLFALLTICVAFGVVYPTLAILFFPVYRLLGGRLDFFSYIKRL